MKPTGQYAYSFDNENFSCEYDSVEEALEDARVEAKQRDEDISYVYIGTVCGFDPVVDPVGVVEDIQDDALDEADEACYGYLESIKEDDWLKLQNMLTETFKRWAKETDNEPNFYTVEGAEIYLLEGNHEY